MRLTLNQIAKLSTLTVFFVSFLALLFVYQGSRLVISAAGECPESFRPVTDSSLGGDVCIQQPPLTGAPSCPGTQYIQPRNLCLTDRLPDSGSDDGSNGANPGTVDNPVLQFPADLPDSPELRSKGFTPENLMSKLIGDILPIVLGLAGFITVILIIVSGIQFIFSSGNPEAAAGARNRLIFALIGFVIIILAFAITQIVDKIFIGTGGTPLQVF